MIEAFLEGEEASFFALCDGDGPPSERRRTMSGAFDGDEGPNTGGMGAYSPAPVRREQARVMREIIEPTLRGMRTRGTPYKGVLYAGLMITAEGPHSSNATCASAIRAQVQCPA